MTRLLIRNARLLDPQAGTETRGDLLVADRRLAAIAVALCVEEREERKE